MLTKEDILRFRADTPGVQNWIHFNNAGAGLMPTPVIEAITRHIELEAHTGGYEAAAIKRKRIARFYTVLAQLLNTDTNKLAYSGSATEAYNTALSSIPFKKGDIILTSREDYVSNQIAFLQLEKRTGIQLVRIADRPEGSFDADDLERLIIKHQPKLVAITHIPTSSGMVQDVYAAGQLCKKYDCLYLLDACQSFGQMPLDVHLLHCDFLTATFRKFMRGPRGAGFLYVSEKVLREGYEPLFLDLQGAGWKSANEYELVPNGRRFETWERSYALVLGAAASMAYALQIGMDNIQRRTTHLAKQLREELEVIMPGKVLDRGIHKSGIVTLKVEGWPPVKLHQTMKAHGINCSITYQGSALLDYQDRSVDWSLRLSPHYYNTEEEIVKVVEVLKHLKV
jgi:selenocysteine lyase/cysteine desulfurase